MSTVKAFFGWLYRAIFGRWATLAEPHNIDYAEQALDITVLDESEAHIEQVEIRRAA